MARRRRSSSTRRSAGEPLPVRAKTALVTLPLGVLQAGTVQFAPELPPSTRPGELQAASKARGCGSAGRVLGERVHDGTLIATSAFSSCAPGRVPRRSGRCLPLRLRRRCLSHWPGRPKADELAGAALEAARAGARWTTCAHCFGTDPRSAQRARSGLHARLASRPVCARIV